MNAAAECSVRRDDDMVSRWVAGTTTANETLAFEQHLLTCDACQAAVEEANAIRAGLAASNVSYRRKFPPWWLAPIGLAAVLMLMVARPRDPFRSLAELGNPPVFGGAPVRVSTDEATAAADRGMEAYLAGDFHTASVLLGTAWEAVPAAPTGFFLGVSLLWDGQAAEAIMTLRAVAADTLSPYAQEARILLGKAWLQIGEVDSSLAALETAGHSPGSEAAHARALADSIRKVKAP